MKTERVVENLNRGLERLLDADPKVLLLGEDIREPYGGAFKASKRLSSLFPDRVLNTPISENAIMGLAGGLALGGYKPIVEFMFGDFLTLAFDQIVNFATKSVSMYGKRVDMNVLARCAVGGNRGYGPTHSQCMQKHFLGIPHLDLYELNAFVDAEAFLPRLVNRGHPCMLFEDKSLYATSTHRGGVVDELFRYELTGSQRDVARVFAQGSQGKDCLIITSGGPFARCAQATQRLLMEHEIEAQILVLTQLYPVSMEDVAPWIPSSRCLCVVEEGMGAGSWGWDLAARLQQRWWNTLESPILVVQSKSSIIPAAQHLERTVLVQADDVYRTILEGLGHA